VDQLFAECDHGWERWKRGKQARPEVKLVGRAFLQVFLEDLRRGCGDREFSILVRNFGNYWEYPEIIWILRNLGYYSMFLAN
jgi:hypothetical protein